MMTDFTIFKQKLREEKKVLEAELATVARRNPDNKNDWEPMASGLDGTPPDRDEATEKIESFEENIAITRQLEARLAEVRNALLRADNGAYGICIICHKDIEQDRLLANPAATTCKEHLNTK